MSGLLQRAKDYLRSHPHLRLVRDDDDFDSFAGTPEERAQIEREIQEAVASQQMSSGSMSSDVGALRSGTGLPILVNVVAIVLIAAGAYLLFQLFDTQEQLIVTPTAVVASAEGLLLAALQEQSAAQLSVKEQEIEAVRSQLATLEAERQAILSESQARLVTLERDLRNEFEQELAAERERLISLQLSDDEIDARLAAFRANREAEIDAQIAAVRSEAEREVAAQQAQIDAMLADVRGELDAAEAERTRLLAEIAAREDSLTAELAARDAQLVEQQSEARRVLAALEEQQRGEQLVRDQVLAYYAAVRDALWADDVDGARAELTGLTDFLERGAIAQSPNLERRRGIELFLAGVLQQRIDAMDTPIEAEVEPAEPDPTLIEEIDTLRSALAAQTDATSERDGLIASLEQRIAELEAERTTIADELVSTTELVARLTEERDALGADLSAARASLSDSEREAETLRGTLAARIAELSAADRARQQAEADRAALTQRIDDQRRLVAAIDEYRAQFVDAERTQAPPTALELLETKLVILRIVGSESIRADHPELFDTLNAYLDELFVYHRATAVDETLREVTVLLDQIASATTGSIAEISARFPLIASQSSGRAADRFLSSLRRVTASDEPALD
ncbi:MAG: hypothetical protein EA382_16995 [Spirochaetaceae bacterium]|nr:MAG: hypothetical protein EA382_16995 [Spirochaetaceae bacterium]